MFEYAWSQHVGRKGEGAVGKSLKTPLIVAVGLFGAIGIGARFRYSLASGRLTRRQEYPGTSDGKPDLARRTGTSHCRRQD